MNAAPATMRLEADSISDKIRCFILSRCLPGQPHATLGDTTPLLTSGILDSFAAQELVLFIEREFQVELDVYETSVDRFDRIEDITASVVRKASSHGGIVGAAS